MTDHHEEAIEAMAEAMHQRECGCDGYEAEQYERGECHHHAGFIDTSREYVTAYLDHAHPTITTVEELTALPKGTVILTAAGHPMWLHRRSLQGWWYRPADEGDFSEDEIALPARVLHWGDR